MEEYPPPAPPAQQKTDLMGQYRTEMKETEHIAVQAPVELNNSFDDLVGYISQNAKTDLLKVWAILCWFSKQNFVLAREKGEQDESTPKGLLELIARKEKSLSQLFDILCRKVGVPCVLLSGYNKGCGGIKPKSPTVNNSWLAVHVEKQWGFVEPMLALRAIKVERPRCLKIESTGKAIHERSSQVSVFGSINEDFFLPDPEYFIYMCRPEKDEWQLLPDPPWTWEEFITAPDRKPRPQPVQPERIDHPPQTSDRPPSPVSLPIDKLSVPDTEDGYPPPEAPKTKQKETITAEEIKRIDTKSRQAPNHLYKSYNDLFGYLFDSLDSDVKKARALLTWMERNCRIYSWSVPREMILNVVDPHTPFGLIKIMSETYSLTDEQSFAVLCREAKLPCRLIRGQKKTPRSYELGDPTTKTKAVWNAVYLDGCWRFVDVDYCLDGVEECEVHLENNAQGVREISRHYREDKFKEFFFLTDPDEFIHFCYPEDAKWQLLEQPISEEQFFGEPWIRPPYFHSPFRLHSAGKVRIDAEDGIAAVLFKGQSTERQPLRYNLYYAEKNWWDVFPEDLQLDSYITTTVVSKKPPVTSLVFRLPVTGTYILEPLNDSEETLCKFIVQSSGDTSKNLALPGDPSVGYGFQQAAQDAGLQEASREEGIIFAREGEKMKFSFRKRPEHGRSSVEPARSVEPAPTRAKATAAEGERVNMKFDAKLVGSGGQELADSGKHVNVTEDELVLVVKATMPSGIQGSNLAVSIFKRENQASKIVLNYIVTSDQRFVAAAAGRTPTEQVKQELIAAIEHDDVDRLEAALREFKASHEETTGDAQRQNRAEEKLLTLHEDEFKQAVMKGDVVGLELAMDSANTSQISINLTRSPWLQGAVKSLERLKRLKRAPEGSSGTQDKQKTPR